MPAKKINGKVKVTLIDLDEQEHTKTVTGGTKASSLIPNDCTALLYPAGDEGSVFKVDTKVRDPELREGDTIELVRKSGKAGK